MSRFDKGFFAVVGFVAFCMVAAAFWPPTPANAVGAVNAEGYEYETVAVSQTDQVCGETGAAGDYLDTVVVKVATSGVNGVVDIQDGSDTAIPLVVASTALGTHSIKLGIKSKSGAWSITTGSAATAICIGKFK
jgi:hypothetical protein